MTESAIEGKVEQLCSIILKSEEFWETKNKAVLVLIDLLLPFEGQSEEHINEVFTPNIFRLLKEPVKAMVVLKFCNLFQQLTLSQCRFAIYGLNKFVTFATYCQQ